jgi:hypothetical protein
MLIIFQGMKLFLPKLRRSFYAIPDGRAIVNNHFGLMSPLSVSHSSGSKILSRTTINLNLYYWIIAQGSNPGLSKLNTGIPEIYLDIS